MNKTTFSSFIKSFDFNTLFNELGWDHYSNKIPVAAADQTFVLNGIVEKRGFVILQCSPQSDGKIPVSNIRKQIEGKLTKFHQEHLIIYIDRNRTQQVWQLALKEENKPKQVRDFQWYVHQDVEGLFQRLKNLVFTLDEEENITIIDVKQRISENFARNTEQVTKKFYDQFKKQHTAFLEFIKGIDDEIGNKENTNKQWYASLMLNRLMFCYFIQKKGFLDQDVHYLGNKLNECKLHAGQDNFYSFYRSFLLELFHDGLGQPKPKRKERLPVALGKIPYLNGGLFDVHELEKQFDTIQINDEAFEHLFSFFDQWNWHLDTSIEATGKDINPDVIGYIFEKYINDRASMGAYYTKEDITDYIGKNTILPYLFDETQRHYKTAYTPDGELWQWMANSGDNYIYDAVKYGINNDQCLFDDLPEEVKEGFLPDMEQQTVTETTTPHLWEIRQTWNQKAPQNMALPTEIYRELIERRKRYANIKSKIEKGEISHINDLITYNLNIRQFAQDVIENTRDPKFVLHFYKSIAGYQDKINPQNSRSPLTILDPTCGSGAFLFAALNILEPLYEACINRMEIFVAESPGKYRDFEDTLQLINSDQHPNLQYFIFKSIILNNLYGVDIMKEAVEIAKLRLFLKLVGSVEVVPRKENFGLEPLPDIDFNIRAGNTLVGFANETELYNTILKKEPMFARELQDNFKDEFQQVTRAFKHFQNSQLINNQGSEEFKLAKAELNKRLAQLNLSLSTYLTTNYGVDAVVKPNDFKKWLITHKPFHWIAEFYQIIAIDGGFDVIIGNPPYVEYSKVKGSYSLLGDIFKTISCGNIYAMTFERGILLSNKSSKLGLIVPISLGSTQRMQSILELNKTSSGECWSSFYAERPSKLFNGAEVLLNITILDRVKLNNSCVKHATGLIKWQAEFRNALFPTLYYVKYLDPIRDYLIPKFSQIIELEISNKVFKSKTELQTLLVSTSNHKIYYRIGGGRYWKIFTTFQPKFSVGGVQTASSRESNLFFKSANDLDAGLISLCSSIFFWYFQVTTNGRDLNPFDLKKFPLPYSLISQDLRIKTLQKLLMVDYKVHKIEKEKISSQTGHIIYEEFYPRKSKPIIDQIDTALAQHYGFTEEELDFIINYDIKYRMGKALYGEADGEEEDE